MVQFFKRFLEWIRLKERLDAAESKPPLFKEGEIWWCAVGENVGTEISGKNKGFSRPVIVFKKYGHLSFFGIPMTSQDKQGSWFVRITQSGIRSTAIVSQGKYYDVRRMYTRMGILDESDYARVKERFLSLHK